MKKIIYALFMLFLTANFVSAQQLDEILQEYFEVNGLAKMENVKTMHMKGKVIQQGFEIPLDVYVKKPGMMKSEASFQGVKFISVLNGEEGWSVNPMTGSTEPQPMGEDELKQSKDQADMEGDLYKWKEKGHTVTFEGEEEVEGTPAYVIKLEKKDGDKSTYYMDAENYVMIKEVSVRNIGGVETEAETFPSNYKSIDGIVMPHTIETRVGGQAAGTIEMETVEFDVELDDSMFEKPASK